MRTLRVPIRIVFYREDGRWLAHCLEFDLIGDGETQGDAWEMLCDAIAVQVAESVRSQNSANLFTPADGKYFEMYAAGKDMSKDVLKANLDPELKVHDEAPSIIDGVEAREYSDADLALA